MKLSGGTVPRRSTTHAVIAVLLGVFGISRASYVLPMAARPASPVLLALFAAQAVCALAAAVGVWRGERWAAGLVIALGVAVAATAVFEGFVLGIVAYLYAVLIVVLALAVALGVAAYLNRR